MLGRNILLNSRHIWGHVWAAARSVFIASQGSVSPLLFSLRIARRICDSHERTSAANSVVIFVTDMFCFSSKVSINASSAARVLCSALHADVNKTLISGATIEILSKCVENDNFSCIRDIIMLASTVVKFMSDIQKHTIALVNSYALVRTGGSCAGSVIHVLDDVVSELQCTTALKLVQCAAITTLYSTPSSSDLRSMCNIIIEKAENALMKLGVVCTESCKCKAFNWSSLSYRNTGATPEERIPEERHTSFLTALVAFSQNFCASRKKGVAFVVNRLSMPGTCHPLLVFFILPTLLPSQQPSVLDKNLKTVAQIVAENGSKVFSFFPLLLNLFTSNDLHVSTALRILKIFPDFATDSRTVPAIACVLRQISCDDSSLFPTIVACSLRLWQRNHNAFTHLLRVLQVQQPYEKLTQTSQVAIALAVLKICTTSINRGSEVLHIASDLAQPSCDPLACRLAITAIACLCESGELEYTSTWNEMNKRFSGNNEPNILAGLLRLARCAAKYDTNISDSDSEVKQKREHDSIQTKTGITEDAFRHAIDLVKSSSALVRATAVATLSAFSVDGIRASLTEHMFRELMNDRSILVKHEVIKLMSRLCSMESVPRAAASPSVASNTYSSQRSGSDSVQSIAIRSLETTSHCGFTGLSRTVMNIASLYLSSYNSDSVKDPKDIFATLETAVRGMDVTSSPSWPVIIAALSSLSAFFQEHSRRGTILNGTITNDLECMQNIFEKVKQNSPASAHICALAASAAVSAVSADKISMISHALKFFGDDILFNASVTASSIGGAALDSAASQIRRNNKKLEEFSLRGGNEQDFYMMLLANSLLAAMIGTQGRSVPHASSKTALTEFHALLLSHTSQSKIGTESNIHQSFAEAFVLGHVTRVLSFLGSANILNIVVLKVLEVCTETEKTSIQPVICAAAPVLIDALRSGMCTADDCSSTVHFMNKFITNPNTPLILAANVSITVASLSTALARTGPATHRTLFQLVHSSLTSLKCRQANDNGASIAINVAYANVCGADFVTPASVDDESLSILASGPIHSQIPSLNPLQIQTSQELAELASSSSIRTSRDAILALSILSRHTKQISSQTSSSQDSVFGGMLYSRLCYNILADPASVHPSSRASATEISLIALSHAGALPNVGWSSLLSNARTIGNSNVDAACIIFDTSRFSAACKAGSGTLGLKVAFSCAEDLIGTMKNLNFNKDSNIAKETCNALSVLAKLNAADAERAALNFIESFAKNIDKSSDNLKEMDKVLKLMCEVVVSDEGCSKVIDLLTQRLLSLPSPLSGISFSSSSVAPTTFDNSKLFSITETSAALFRIAARKQGQNSVDDVISRCCTNLISNIETVSAALASGIMEGFVSLSQIFVVRQWLSTVNAEDSELHTRAVLSSMLIGHAIGAATTVSNESRIQWFSDCLDSAIIAQRKYGSVPLAFLALISHAFVSDPSYTLLTNFCAKQEAHKISVVAALSGEATPHLFASLPLELEIFVHSLDNTCELDSFEKVKRKVLMLCENAPKLTLLFAPLMN